MAKRKFGYFGAGLVRTDRAKDSFCGQIEIVDLYSAAVAFHALHPHWVPGVLALSNPTANEFWVGRIKLKSGKVVVRKARRYSTGPSPHGQPAILRRTLVAGKARV